MFLVLSDRPTVESRLLHLARAEAAEGASVCVLTNAAIECAQARRVDVRNLDDRLLPRSPDELAEISRLNVLAFAVGLRLESAPLDVVVAHGWTALPASVRLARRRGVPLVLDADDEGSLASSSLDPLRRECQAWVSREVTRMLVSRQATKDRVVLETGVDPARVQLVPGLAEGTASTLVAYAKAIEDARERALPIVMPETDRTPEATGRRGNAPVYDVGIADGARWDLVDYVVCRFPRTVATKGLPPEEQARALASCRAVVIPAGASDPTETALNALAAGALPVFMGRAAEGVASALGRGRLPVVREGVDPVPVLAHWLSDDSARARAVRQAADGFPETQRRTRQDGPTQAHSSCPKPRRPRRDRACRQPSAPRLGAWAAPRQRT